MTRQEANKKILELIAAEVEINPDLRFNQIIINMGLSISISDSYWEYEQYNHLDYYEEPMVTLQRITGN